MHSHDLTAHRADERAADEKLATYHADDFAPEDLLRLKRAAGLTISVVLPARNEQDTVAGVVDPLRRHLVDELPLIDELIVMDSFCDDDTPQRARAAGAEVIACADVAPELPAVRGKGEALWRSLFATTGDLIVFVDADLRGAGPHYVTGLLGPLLTDPATQLVKGRYRRPFVTAESVEPEGGGRVTELVARPLLALHWPRLRLLAQPLGGEWAGRRELLEQLRFPTGYGVEIGVLLDTLARHGLSGIAEVELGRRMHKHQSLHALGVMAAEVMGTALRRLDREPAGDTLHQHYYDGGQAATRARPVPLLERPPAVTVPGYRDRLPELQRQAG